jgi:hypothetical protein
MVWGIILLTGSLPVWSQEKISFFEEYIDFELDSIHFSINGIYSFKNLSEKRVSQRIIFPFAVETNQIDSIHILNLNDLNQIQFQRLKNAIEFYIIVAPCDTIDVNIFYRQKVTKTNTYIITSTQSWNKPLEKAVYTLISSLLVNEKQFSYPFVYKDVVNGKFLYRWEETNFMPDKEFIVVIDKNNI